MGSDGVGIRGIGGPDMCRFVLLSGKCAGMLMEHDWGDCLVDSCGWMWGGGMRNLRCRVKVWVCIYLIRASRLSVQSGVDQQWDW